MVTFIKDSVNKNTAQNKISIDCLF